MSDPKLYTVGWICAITPEYTAACQFLDEQHDRPDRVSANDTNDYTLGKMSGHNVVIAVLPDGEYGLSSATGVAMNMLNSFPNIRIGLMVGVGGGVPTAKNDIRLGDIVVSSPRDNAGGVYQYDYGKTIQGQSFHQTGFLNQPPTIIRTAVSGLRSKYEADGHQIEERILAVFDKRPRLRKKYSRPSHESDILFKSHVVHPYEVEGGCKELCGNQPSDIVVREQREEDDDNPAIHYGVIASANQLMKDATMRDSLAKEREILCFEMEAAGLMNRFPCLVVRGICDYSDSHKNKAWQGYAAMTAAAYTKDLLSRVIPSRVENEERACQAMARDIKVVEEGVNILRERAHDLDQQKILDWLTTIDYAPLQNDFISLRQPGTGEWLLNSDKFKNWLASSKQTLFCLGIPGAGKTIMTSLVVAHLQEKFRNDPTVGIAYIYGNFKREQDQKPEKLLASLLKQLAQCRKDVLQTIIELYGSHMNLRTRPSFDDLLKTLRTVLAGPSRNFILIDALDECRHVGSQVRSLSAICELRNKTDANVLVTSRYIPDIMEAFDDCTKLEVRAGDEDIGKSLDTWMRRLPYVSSRPELQQEVKSAIIQAAKGMFLLARLHMMSLEGPMSPKVMRSALQRLPSGSEAYDKAYDTAMERIVTQNDRSRTLAMRVLAWIVCAKEQLTVMALQYALAVERGQSYLDEDNIIEAPALVSSCEGLVTVNKENNIVSLLHYTTHEYLSRNQDRWFPDCQIDLSYTCLTYLSFKADRSNCFPFFSYAARYWGYHAKECPEKDAIEFCKLLNDRSMVLASAQLFLSWSHNPLEHITVGHLAAWFGVQHMLSWLLDHGLDVNASDNNGKSLLYYAASHGSANTVTLLLERGANINARCGSSGTALHGAAGHSQDEIVRVLLDSGADANAHRNTGNSPLWFASVFGFERIVRMLLSAGADVNVQCESMGNALTAAMIGDNDNIIRMSLEAGTDVNAQGRYGSALSLAVLRGNHKLVQTLLDAGADIDARGTNNISALQLAMYKGDRKIVGILLNKGANPNAINGSCLQSPLRLASERGYTSMMECLMRAGCDVNNQDASWGDTIRGAAGGGHARNVELLIKCGVDADSRNESLLCETPLMVAAERGHLDVVKSLIQLGAQLNLQDLSKMTALHYAAENGHFDVVKALIEAECAKNEVDVHERTPLDCAQGRGPGPGRVSFPEVATYLREHGCRCNSQAESDS